MDAGECTPPSSDVEQQVPVVEAPAALKALSELGELRGVDVTAVTRLDDMMQFDDGGASADEKAARWRALGRAVPGFADQATRRATAWVRFAAQQRAAEAARRRRAEAREADWQRLEALLGLSRAVTTAQKLRWGTAFVKTYGATAAENPHVDAVSGFVDPKAGVGWVRIEGGSFSMGSKDGEDDEKPVRAVNVPTFEIAKVEVTVAQYGACVGAGECTPPNRDGEQCNWGKPGRDGHPVNCVDWNQARQYARWVGGRLPSEAEWEYAARSGGRDQMYPWGDEKATCERAVMDDGGNGCGKNGTSPVCSKREGHSAQGLCDTAGNVWEWVEDVYGGHGDAPSDGSAQRAGGGNRVRRGGSWWDNARFLRAAYRDRYAPTNRYADVGFRPARSKP